MLSAAGAADDLLCAAYLHDVVEDTSVSLLQIEDEFGSEVARLVAAVTKSPRQQGEVTLTKADINRLVFESMAQADADVAALKAADLLANISDLVIDQAQHGYAGRRSSVTTRKASWGTTSAWLTCCWVDWPTMRPTTCASAPISFARSWMVGSSDFQQVIAAPVAIEVAGPCGAWAYAEQITAVMLSTWHAYTVTCSR